MFDTKDKNFIKKSFDNLLNDEEFELMFNNYNKNNPLVLTKYLNILKYLIHRSDVNKLKLKKENTLDISYNYDKDTFNIYRISIDGMENINNIIKKIYNRKNHVIFSILASKIKNNSDKSISIIKKIKNPKNINDFDNYDIRLRKSKELKLNKNELEKLLEIDESERFNISYRLKQRVSLFLLDNQDAKLRIDLTNVKSNFDIKFLNNSGEIYELEIDFMKKSKNSKNMNKYFNMMMEETYNLKKVLQQSYDLISNNIVNSVLNNYKKLILGDQNAKMKNLYMMNSVSLQIQNVTDNLPNKYTVTDKADGERCGLIIHDNKLFFISSILDIKYSGIELPKNLSEYNNTIIDGEYIFLENKNKFLYAAFDILYYKNKDVREEEKLMKRHEYLNDVISKLGFKYKFNTYNMNFEMNKLNKFFRDNLNDYYNYLDKYISTSKNSNIISMKYFIYPTGGHDCELFSYSNLMYEIITTNNKVPYHNDGLMYTPLNQIYTRISRDIKNKTFKWKPPNQNSIDFYIEFEKDRDTKKILNVFDNTDENNIEGKNYRICNLHNGKVINSTEKPVLFQKNNNLYLSYLYLEDGDVRDIEGNIIQDKTVVEFYYNNDPDIREQFRWVPMRTRYDKTENVKKYKRKYGNNIEIANRVWHSIKNGFTIADIISLSTEISYESSLAILRKKVDLTSIYYEKKDDIYYQLTTNIAKPLKDYHNGWIKSNFIYLYCGIKNTRKGKRGMRILDVGCGRGGDIMKFYHSRVESYVGFDPDHHGLYNQGNGAISRYNLAKTKYPNFPKMEFLIGDASYLLNYEDQMKGLGKMTDQNKKMLKDIFGENKNKLKLRKYDVFNCQFMLHFLFENDKKWNNFCENINNFLDNDGYLLITTMDGEVVNDLFNKNNGVISSYYNNEKGEKQLFFEAKRQYKKTDNIDKTGYAYDIYIRMFKEEGNYDKEFIVSPNYLIKELKEKCNLELIETDRFAGIYEKYRDFLENTAKFEEKPTTRKFFMKAKEFYNMKNEVNVASLKLSKLYRYYVFKKKYSKLDFNLLKTKKHVNYTSSDSLRGRGGARRVGRNSRKSKYNII